MSHRGTTRCPRGHIVSVDHLHFAKDINNMACAFLVEGDYRRAIETFVEVITLLSIPTEVFPIFRDGSNRVEALSFMKFYSDSLLHTFDVVQERLLEAGLAEYITEDGFNDALLSDYIKRRGAIFVLPATGGGGGAGGGGGGSGGLLVQTKPILLVPSPSETVALGVEEASAAVLHNMALAYHLSASSSAAASTISESTRNSLLDAALYYYRECAGITLRLDATSNGGRSVIAGGNTARLTPSCLNNMGQILIEHSGEMFEGKNLFLILGILLRDPIVSASLNRECGNGWCIYVLNVMMATKRADEVMTN